MLASQNQQMARARDGRGRDASGHRDETDRHDDQNEDEAEQGSFRGLSSQDQTQRNPGDVGGALPVEEAVRPAPWEVGCEAEQ